MTHLWWLSSESMNSDIRILRSSGITKYSFPSGPVVIPSAYPFGVTATVTSFSPSKCLQQTKITLIWFVIYDKGV